MKHLKSAARQLINSVTSPLGIHVQRARSNAEIAWTCPSDTSLESFEMCQLVKPYTMTTAARIISIVDCIDYLISAGIEGAFVECGVWKGGSAMAMMKALLNRRVSDRPFYLYDTYAGMPAPSEKDVTLHGDRAVDKFPKVKTSDDSADWNFSPLDEVKANIESTGYPVERVSYIVGKVEETIPATVPEKIALLRLDTDFYESTKHELVHLFPRLERGGVLILDDYGHWEGARLATDEYLQHSKSKILLHRIDYAARVGVKVS
jgi:O-methyltransferase